MMTLSEELKWRGFVNQTTFTDLADLDETKLTFYHGFDASADSQTIGNLAAMMLDKLFIRHGHKAILLAGGATSLIGDPGGKDKERPMQTESDVARNVAAAEKQLKLIFAGDNFTLVNNLDWIKSLSTIEFLRDVGKHFSMSTLVQRDYIQKRIGEGGSGMTYTEFSYTLLQGYDFLHLFNKYNCRLQLAGSDQWGNSLSGVDLVRRVSGEVVNVLTLPLIINKATGRKFGKSEDGAIWLDENKTSVYKFYQFWLNLDDVWVIDYLKIYTTLSYEEIKNLEVQTKEAPGRRLAQKTLALEVTKLVHGQKKAEAARRVTEVLFDSADAGQMSAVELKQLAAELPNIKSSSLTEALVETNLASSNSEARRLLAANSISINGQKQTTEVKLSNPCILRRGKNQFAIKL